MSFVKSKIQPIFHIPSDSKLHYKSYQDTLARFAQDNQLLRPHLWERFVAQFVEQIDGTNMGWRGEYFGKMLRGGCLTYQYTHSHALYQTLEKAVIAMMKVQEPSGRISSFSLDTEFDAWDLWCRKYVILGMEYFLEICKNERLRSRILRCIQRQADYIIRYVGPKEGQKEICLCTRHWGGLNSCSILEPFVRLYRLTGENAYLDFSEYIISTGFCADGNLIELVRLGIEPYRFPQVKAYEMMSCFEGLIEYALLMGREDYLNDAISFAKSVHQSDVTIIGCCGCTHELFDHSAVKQTEYSDGIMQETCVTVTWMKLCYRLLQATGDAVFADWIEEASLNAMSGAVNDFGNHRNQALTFDSYSPLVRNERGRAVGGKQMIGNDEYYGCCACIGSAGTAIANLYGFMKTQQGIVLNHYQPGKIEFITPGGQKAVLRILSHLPFSGKITIKVDLEVGEVFEIAFRIPGWSKNTKFRIGENVCANPQAGRYFTCCREWSFEDEITLLLDVSARAEQLNGKIAIIKGGYVLASDARHGAHYADPIALTVTKSGLVRHLNREKPTVRAQMQFSLCTDDRKQIKLIDYASAAKNWDDLKSGANVWFDTK